MRTVKTLIRLGRCPGWSESSLGVHASLLVLSWGGSYVLKVWWDALCTEGGEEQPSPIKLGVPRQDQIAQSARWFHWGLAIYRCHAGLSCTSDAYPPVCINWWLSRFPGLRWFHRIFPSYMAEIYIGFPPSQDRPGRPLVIPTLWSVMHQ